MWLNQLTIDAIRIMAALALRWPEQARASDLPGETGITFMNAQKTVHRLGVAHLLDTQRGRNGGIRLARPPDTISIGEIVRAFEPTDCPVSFLAGSEVERSISKLLFRAHREFFQPLETKTLDQLIGRNIELQAARIEA
jgi:Rrf2 family nitric oxide-sensitive transcriptional repressor